MKTGAAYARYSTDKQCSIEVQFALIEKYCTQNGILLAEQHKYGDEAQTGMRKTNRHGFLELVAAADAGEFEFIETKGNSHTGISNKRVVTRYCYLERESRIYKRPIKKNTLLRLL